MKTLRNGLAATSLALLGACGGQSGDTIEGTAATGTEAAARTVDDQAKAAAAAGHQPMADQLSIQAGTIRERGDKVEEAVDEVETTTT